MSRNTRRITTDARRPAAVPAEEEDLAGIEGGQQAEEAVAEDRPICVVTKKFKLRLDDHTTVEYQPGTQRMPRSHAEHWFSVAHGVTVFEDEEKSEE